MTWLTRLGRVAAGTVVTVMAIGWLSFQIEAPQRPERTLGEWALAPTLVLASPPDDARRRYRATMGIGFPWKQVPIRLEWQVARGVDGCDHVLHMKVERTGGSRWTRIENMEATPKGCRGDETTVPMETVVVRYQKRWVGIGAQVRADGTIEVTGGGVVRKTTAD